MTKVTGLLLLAMNLYRISATPTKQKGGIYASLFLLKKNTIRVIA